MNKKRLIVSSVISIFLVATLLLGSTYSIFTSQEIDENTNVYTTGNLEVTYSVSGSVKITDITPMNEEKADGVIPYRITINNKGNVPYMFDVILKDTTSSEENTIDYQYIMTKVGYLESKSLSECSISEKNIVIKEDVILPAGQSIDIDVRVWLSDSIQNTEIGKSFYSKLMIDGLAVYNDNEEIDNSLLSLRYMNTSSANDLLHTNYVKKIKTASFVNYIDTSNASINAENNEKIIWDMSTSQDDSVIAWLEPNENESYYNLYIGSKNMIYAKSFSRFFYNMSSLENINFTNLDTSLATNMYSMFENCSGLVNLDLSGFDTRNVTSMNVPGDYSYGGMFRNCSSLVSLNISSFDTSKVVLFGNMFNGCSSLTSLELDNFDTSSATDMSHMFYKCTNLASLDLSSFNTSKVTTMYSMFGFSANLTTVNLSSFDTSKVTSMQDMFRECRGLASLDLSNFNTNKVTNMQYMFRLCISLTSLDISNFDTSELLNVQGMFFGCSGLTELDLSSFDTSNVTDMSSMFSGCSNLTTLNLGSNFNTSNVTTMSSMFDGCSNLTTLNLGSNFNTSNVTNMSSMFTGCSNLTTTITIMNVGITSYSLMFYRAATAEGASITVNYISDIEGTAENESTEELVGLMVATKSNGSNVEKGECANCI